jgi:hypothetical protein
MMNVVVVVDDDVVVVDVVPSFVRRDQSRSRKSVYTFDPSKAIENIRKKATYHQKL